MDRSIYSLKDLLACAQAAGTDDLAFAQLKRWVEGGANLFQPLARMDVDQDPFVEAGDTVAGVIFRELGAGLAGEGHPSQSNGRGVTGISGTRQTHALLTRIPH
ncbi:hypothetical protein ACULMH_13345 [Xanthomonas arboricola pv. corylina]|uniref:hypothetical protein n=1 Tax=Xanthomonas arboricola TaxID=56448 RepID=UPI0005857244|nr:hypothetical protein [Xanthomonas arboricola]